MCCVFLKKFSKVFVLVVCCFAINISSGSATTDRADLVKRGFLIGLHYLKQRSDTPDWVKKEKIKQEGDLKSSFSDIADAFGEIVDCRKDRKTPRINYTKEVMLKPEHWNYVFIKRWIYRNIYQEKSFDDIYSELLTEYPGCVNELKSARSDAKCYIYGLKFDKICPKVRESLDNTPIFGGHMSAFYGLSPHTIFPNLSLLSSLPEDIKTLWQPAPPFDGTTHRHHMPPFGPPPAAHNLPPFDGGQPRAHMPPPPRGPHMPPNHASYWFIDCLPENIKTQHMPNHRPPFGPQHRPPHMHGPSGHRMPPPPPPGGHRGPPPFNRH